jgi:prepilin-type N-terminal cleavage/methylation domain-containing protein
MPDNVRRSLRDQRGFTLIELLVVICIMGILCAVAVPTLSGQQRRARAAQAKAAARKAQYAKDMPARKAQYAKDMPASATSTAPHVSTVHHPLHIPWALIGIIGGGGLLLAGSSTGTVVAVRRRRRRGVEALHRGMTLDLRTAYPVREFSGVPLSKHARRDAIKMRAAAGPISQTTAGGNLALSQWARQSEGAAKAITATSTRK